MAVQQGIPGLFAFGFTSTETTALPIDMTREEASSDFLSEVSEIGTKCAQA
jgi:hypothetical protein